MIKHHRSVFLHWLALCFLLFYSSSFLLKGQLIDEFGSYPVGTTFTWQEVAPADLCSDTNGSYMLDVSIVGPDASDFVTVQDYYGETLAFGQEYWLAISFTPSHAGVENATIYLTYIDLTSQDYYICTDPYYYLTGTGTVSISGHIYSSNGSPIPGASVHIGNYATTSASDGSYSIAGFINETYNATVSSQNYFTATTSLTVPGSSQGLTQDFSLTPSTAEITVLADPTQGGTVTGSGTYTVNSNAQISATPAVNYTFAGWSDGDTDNPRTITVPAEGATYTADFNSGSSTTEITAIPNPAQGGTVTGGGLYATGNDVTLTAMPSMFYTFAGWSDGNNDNPRVVTVPEGGATYIAEFSPTAVLTIYHEPEAWFGQQTGIYGVGHVFVGLTSATGQTIIDGFYPYNTNPLWWGHGHVQNDSNTLWDYAISYPITEQQWYNVALDIELDSAIPPVYSLTSFNCVDWAAKLASAAGVTLPPYKDAAGISDPYIFGYVLRGLGAGTIYINNGLVIENTGNNFDAVRALGNGVSADTTTNQIPYDYSYSATESVGHTNAAGLATSLQLAYDTNNLGTVNANTTNGLSLVIIGANLSQDLISMNWGDGSAFQEQSLAFSHVYSNGTYNANLLIIDAGAVHTYNMTVIVSPATGASISVNVTPFSPVTIPNPGLTFANSAGILITAQPTNEIVTIGNSATLNISALGPGPFAYRWQFDGTNILISVINTVAGNGTNGYSGDGGQATNAELFGVNLAADTAGNLLIADWSNNRVRKVSTSGIITTVVGNGTGGFFGDGGQATNAELYYVAGVAVDSTGNLFMTDEANARVRKVGTNGIITTLAGNGKDGYSGDGGAATNAELYFNNYPDLATDSAGNLFFADVENNRVRKVGTNGIITTLAGNGTAAYSGDGGAATNAELSFPNSVAIDASGDVFIADTDNKVIRKVGTNGIITTVAGNGTLGYSGDGGAATNAELNYPLGVGVDVSGNVFIADTYNNVIRKVSTNGIIMTVVGNGTRGYSGDGSTPTNAELYAPFGVAVDVIGNLYIADVGNKRIRKVSGAGPTLTLPMTSLNNSGYYDVIVSSSYGSVTSSIVDLTVAPAVQYNANQTSGSVPLTVQFTAQGVDSEGNQIAQWNWNFGDGANSTIQDPSHTYTNVGTFQPSLIATNNLGVTIFGIGPSINVVFNSGLVLNGGFETGDFTDWTLSGSDTNDIFVDDGSQTGIAPHSGQYLAALGPVGSLSYLSQILVTTPKAQYMLSLWLNSPDGETPNAFLVSWNGSTLFYQTNLLAIGWTNLQFTVNATSGSTILQFGAEDDPSYLGLDDISLLSSTAAPSIPILSSPQITIGNTNFTFLLSGLSGSNYVLQMSTNLLTWSPVSTSSIPVSGSVTLSNSISGYNQRFYRVYQQ